MSTLRVNDDGFVLARDARATGRLAELRRALAAGQLRRERAGVYRPVTETDLSVPISVRKRAEYLTKVRAVAQTHRDPVFTGYSAIALIGAPIIGDWPDTVYVLSRDKHGHRRGDVIAVARRVDVDIHAAGGHAVTSTEFSLLQLSRQGSLLAALTATDAAIHRPRKGGVALTTLDQIRSEHDRLAPYPGMLRAEAVLTRANPLSESPLETLSRVVIEEAGFPEPVLQHRLWLAEFGKSAYLDFFWPEYGVAAEADGGGKYRGDGTVDVTIDTVIDEKHREDAIRRQVRGFTRWEWDDAWSNGGAVLVGRLRAAGLPVVRRPCILR